MALRKNAWEFGQEKIGYYGSRKMLPGWNVIKPALLNVRYKLLQDVVKLLIYSDLGHSM